MYETFADAKNAAMRVINRLYNGEKMNCVVVETKGKKKTWFNFRFHDTDTLGMFVPVGNIQERRTRI